MIYTAQLSDRLEELDVPDTVKDGQVAEHFFEKFKEYPIVVIPVPKPTWESIRDGAQEAKISSPCVSCGKYFWYYPNPTSIAEGHVRTDEGMAETRISRLCEFCFDAATVDSDSHTSDGD